MKKEPVPPGYARNKCGRCGQAHIDPIVAVYVHPRTRRTTPILGCTHECPAGPDWHSPMLLPGIFDRAPDPLLGQNIPDTHLAGAEEPPPSPPLGETA